VIPLEEMNLYAPALQRRQFVDDGLKAGIDNPAL
jgi:hypothetical protein